MNMAHFDSEQVTFIFANTLVLDKIRKIMGNLTLIFPCELAATRTLLPGRQHTALTKSDDSSVCYTR